MSELQDQAWAVPLIAGVRDRGITRTNKDRMFELRFAHALWPKFFGWRMEVRRLRTSNSAWGLLTHASSV